MEKSKKGKLNKRDFFRGALFASAGALTPICTMLIAGQIDSKIIVTSVLAFAGTFGMYVIKNLPEGEK